MKDIKIIGIMVLAVLSMPLVRVSGQVKDTKLQEKLDNVKAQFVEFNTERMLDSLDQEKLPRIVSGGLLAGANMSNFIITRNHKPMSSYMRIGAELGGFIDFRLSKHFSIQPQVLFTAQENYFAATDTANHLWSFGMDIPVYFLGRFGNMTQGYIQFGGGIFTHFTFASNVANTYRSYDKPSGTGEQTDGYDYSRLYTLHNNHFGLCVTVGYECTFGMQINLQYKVSLSDIAGFYTEMKGQDVADALIYPQCISLSLGYRWK
ncbi:MAG: outer membrane beta-barrel protein [Paludibacteraceae bacterium]|nr:outer membrane beta-barrel protein [Paludibacteraceae bacterium]